jgi:hypothetical protein
MKSETPMIDAIVSKCSKWDSLDLINLIEAGKKLEKDRNYYKALLSEIHLTAHCVAKSGPLSTPTLEVAYSKFNQIAAMATKRPR